MTQFLIVMAAAISYTVFMDLSFGINVLKGWKEFIAVMIPCGLIGYTMSKVLN